MIESALKSLLTEGGILTSLLVLSVALGITIAVYLQKKLDRCQNDLLESVRAFGDIAKANTVAIAAWTIENSARTRAHEAMGHALSLSTQEIASFKTEIAWLRNELTEANKRSRSQP